MSSKLIAFILFLMLVVNIGAIFSIEYDKYQANDKKNVQKNDKVESQEDVKDGNSDKDIDKDVNKDAGNVAVNNNDDNDTKGEISTGGLFVNNNVASQTPNYKALERSKINQTKMQQKDRWIATNYVYGDITTNTWKVQRGDTLWEISEARYGTGKKWTRIRDLNQSKVSKSNNGIRNQVIPGQILLLK